MNFGAKRRKLLFKLYFWLISLYIYSNLRCRHSLDAKLNFTPNKYPLSILLRRPALIKIAGTLKKIVQRVFLMYVHFFSMWVFSKVCIMGTRSMWNLILHPTSVYYLNLSKFIRR